MHLKCLIVVYLRYCNHLQYSKMFSIAKPLKCQKYRIKILYNFGKQTFFGAFSCTIPDRRQFTHIFLKNIIFFFNFYITFRNFSYHTKFLGRFGAFLQKGIGVRVGVIQAGSYRAPAFVILTAHMTLETIYKLNIYRNYNKKIYGCP